MEKLYIKKKKTITIIWKYILILNVSYPIQADIMDFYHINEEPKFNFHHNGYIIWIKTYNILDEEVTTSFILKSIEKTIIWYNIMYSIILYNSILLLLY